MHHFQMEFRSPSPQAQSQILRVGAAPFRVQKGADLASTASTKNFSLQNCHPDRSSPLLVALAF
jgi:hypothetical protein